MATLFELTKEQKQLLDMVESGQLSQADAADTFESMGEMLNDKINGYVGVYGELTRQAQTIDAEIDRLTALKKTKANEIKNLKEHLRLGLESVGQSKFDTGLYKGYFRKGAISVEIENSDQIPAKYVETKLTERPDKKLIKQALESGKIVSGAKLVTGDPSLTIK